ncbi:efflux RND transporter periplasmic adaptor subunit [Pseudoalteromonas sp. H105]|uniref:efflux RND transporter periplasmic adaptor subunit n=1 Tax=Pseudoalteromonas sp. H105 TaxID=1348393 RepID=UPI0007322CC4|nr:efflux RND transporter periplasmic adaptor subunit [Pseudoalteromonas sp. H105]KTF15272.1 hemolysin D [Pseudoalteromonas sp. H105]
MHTNFKLLIAGLAGAVIATAGLNFIDNAAHVSGASAEKKPLYWVAPMDSNYRRDEPGLSPMGMDLVPVYEMEDNNNHDGPGAITISPAVVNNLGVRTADVQFKALQNEVRTVGYVQYNQDQLVHIHPRVEGWLETLYVKSEGDQVTQGEPLYTLYSPQLVNAQEEFILAINRNNTVLIRAAKARLYSLNISDSFITRLEKTKQVTQNVTFYARKSGVVDELNIREGFYVKPGTSMMSIAQLDEVWIEAEVFERQAELIELGLPVTMTLDYISGQSWRGKVDYIYPTLDAKNRTLRVRLRFNNQDHQLKPNMFAQVSIQVKAAQEQLIVPKEAVIRTGSQDRVVVALGEGRFKSVAVALGRSDNNDTVILSGLKEGDKVVTSAQFLLDSESSKSSDFKRMQTPIEAARVWGKGVVNNVMKHHRMVNISHEPMDELGWPSMTMDFTLAEGMDMQALKAGQTLHFELTKAAEGNYLISGIHIMDATHVMSDADNMATVTGTINRIDKLAGVANISRGPIEKWNRGPATMDFKFAKDLDLAGLNAEQTMTFTFSVQEGEFVINDIAVESIKQLHSGH